MDHAISRIPSNIPFRLIEEITDNFSEGVHKDGRKIAVKKLYNTPGLEEMQFLNEFNNLARLQHQNIVQLVGYCHEIQKICVEHNGRLVFADQNDWVLCFEYMYHGSLDKHLSDEYHGLDWNKRYEIIKGICKGLKYLHEELESPMYHLDLKPANILLDENMVPKIADFGLSRFFREGTQITKSSIGTHGYTPPEYIMGSIISNKFDIFSLGVVIIKIMTGRTGYFESADMSPGHFIEQVEKNWRNRLQAMPIRMLESYSKQVKTCIEIALSCVVPDRHKRPSIGDIVRQLNETETMIHKSTVQISPKLADELNSDVISAAPSQVPLPGFDMSTLQVRLRATVQGSVEAWTYAIFWTSSQGAATGSNLLGWGDGYYQFCQDDGNHVERRHSTPAAQAEQEHRKRVLRELSRLIGLLPLPGGPAHAPDEDDAEWFFVTSNAQSLLNTPSVPGQEQEHRKRVLRKLRDLISDESSSSNVDPWEEEVTDCEWFFLVSMTQSFLVGSGLLGKTLLAAQPIWITSAGLSSFPCERAREAYNFGLRTMACIPIGTGVLELGSTDVILQTSERMGKILSLFDLPAHPEFVSLKKR